MYNFENDFIEVIPSLKVFRIQLMLPHYEKTMYICGLTEPTLLGKITLTLSLALLDVTIWEVKVFLSKVIGLSFYIFYVHRGMFI